MYCPVCKSEFGEGLESCPNCKCSLVEKLLEGERQNSHDERVSFLTNVRDDYEAAIVESILNSNNIKVLRKYCEAGDYLNIYMGNSFLGIDLYVPENDYETAKELIEAGEEAKEIENEELAEEETTPEQDEVSANKSRSLKAWMILIFFTSGIFALVIYLVTIIMSKIFK